MKDLVIVCAGATAHEVYSIIEMINTEEIAKGNKPKYNILGFIDDNPNSRLQNYVKVPILGTIKDWQPKGEEVYALANSSPKAKEKIVNILKPRGCKFETIIAPYSRVKPYAEIGEGSIIYAFNINNGAKIGKFVNIQGSIVAGRAVIGDYSTTLGFSNISPGPIGKRVYVGAGAVVLRPVGDDAVVGVGSIVVSKVKAGTKVFGNPAKRVEW